MRGDWRPTHRLHRSAAREMNSARAWGVAPYMGCRAMHGVSLGMKLAVRSTGRTGFRSAFPKTARVPDAITDIRRRPVSKVCHASRIRVNRHERRNPNATVSSDSAKCILRGQRCSIFEPKCGCTDASTSSETALRHSLRRRYRLFNPSDQWDRQWTLYRRSVTQCASPWRASAGAWVSWRWRVRKPLRRCLSTEIALSLATRARCPAADGSTSTPSSSDTRGSLVSPCSGLWAYLWLISTYGPQSYSNSFLLIILAFALGIGIVSLFQIKRQAMEIESHRAEAHTDCLTGVANRRGFDTEFSRRLAQRQRQGKALSLMIVDIDDFKSMNDTHGHARGDLVIKGIAHTLTAACRDADTVARFGGDEFVVLLPGSPLETACVTAERIRSKISSTPFRDGDWEHTSTVSIGLAEALVDDDTTSLLKRADSALYAAKDAGRNSCYRDGGPRARSPTPSRPAGTQ